MRSGLGQSLFKLARWSIAERRHCRGAVATVWQIGDTEAWLAIAGNEVIVFPDYL